MRTSGTEALAQARLGSESGFTLVEVLVAVVILTTGVLAMVMTFDSSRRLSLVSERSATMAHMAQKEIERVESLSYDQIGMTATPVASTDPSNPDYYVTAGSPPSFAWDRANGTKEDVDVDASAGTVTLVQSWSEGNLSGQIYDFITWTSDPKCAPGCPASQDYKRITVAVTMASGLHPDPVYVSSVIADPQAMPAGGISNGNGGNPLNDPSTKCKNSSGITVTCTSPIDSGNPNTFFLHDWAATNAGSPTLPSGNHVTHATVGVVNGLLCTASQLLGQLLGNITGCPTPDLMDSTPPSSSGTANLYNYSTDLATSGFPGGRLIQPTCANNSGCGTGSTSDCNGGGWVSSLLKVQSQFWVSAPVTATTTLTGDAGISMFTQTLNSANAVVSFCIDIYDVPPSGSAGSLGDLIAWPPVDLGGAGYIAATDPQTSSNWPSSASQLSYIFNFRGSNGSISIAPGHRIGVRIWMKANANVPIDLLYDNPLYPSEIQLNTT